MERSKQGCTKSERPKSTLEDRYAQLLQRIERNCECGAKCKTPCKDILSSKELMQPLMSRIFFFDGDANLTRERVFGELSGSYTVKPAKSGLKKWEYR
jgi:hypothetical protein